MSIDARSGSEKYRERGEDERIVGMNISEIESIGLRDEIADHFAKQK